VPAPATKCCRPSSSCAPVAAPRPARRPRMVRVTDLQCFPAVRPGAGRAV